MSFFLLAMEDVSEGFNEQMAIIRTAVWSDQKDFDSFFQ